MPNEHHARVQLGMLPDRPPKSRRNGATLSICAHEAGQTQFSTLSVTEGA